MGNTVIVQPDQPPQTPSVTYARDFSGQRIGSLQRVEKDTFLVVNSWAIISGGPLSVRARILDDSGGIAYVDETHTAATDRSLKTTYHALPQGYLLDFSVGSPPAGTRRGTCYVQAGLAHRREPVPEVFQVLAKGYVTVQGGLIWPGGSYCDSLEGPGAFYSLAGADPAAGAELTYTVPAGVRWRLISLIVNFVTSAAVADRYPSLIIDDGANRLFLSAQATKVTANANVWLTYAQGATESNTVNNRQTQGLPLGQNLIAGWRIVSDTGGLDAGDNYGAPRLLVEEWIEP